MAEMRDLCCPNCAAPMTVTTSQCTYCKIHVVAVADEGGPAPPPVVVEGRSQRLARELDLDGQKVRELWRLSAPAWDKRRRGVTLSDEETFACDVLLATLGTALIAARGGETRETLALSLHSVSGQVLSVADASNVLLECEQYLEGEGEEECLGVAAELLQEAGLVKKGYELAVGIVLVQGTLSPESSNPEPD